MTYEVYAFRPHSIKQWDNIDIHPRTIIGYTNNVADVEQCEETDADFYSVYIHHVDSGIHYIADLPTKVQANRFCNLLKALILNYKDNGFLNIE